MVQPDTLRSYETDFIIATADSILKLSVGDTLYAQFSLRNRNPMRYEYIEDNKRGWHDPEVGVSTRGDFVSAVVWYYFRHHEYEWMKRNFRIELDRDLKLSEISSLNFVPQDIRQGRPLSYVSEREALRLARRDMLLRGIMEAKVYNRYDEKREAWVWEVYSILTCEFTQRSGGVGYMDSVIIDMLSGQIISHEILSYIHGNC